MSPGKPTEKDFELSSKPKDKEEFLGQNLYVNDEKILKLFKELAENESKIAKVHNLGKSHEERDLIAIQITKGVLEERAPLKPMFKYVANMHGDETLGRQLLVYFAQYLVENYKENDEVKLLVDTTDIFLMPTMNPDGYVKGKVNIDAILKSWLRHTAITLIGKTHFD